MATPTGRRRTASRRWPWALREDESRPFFKRALDVGINFFDTANVYSAGASEEVIGRALKELARREEVVLATKVHGAMSAGPNGRGLSRKAIFQEIDASLRRLGTDYVDLYQIHRWDYATPIEETLEALHDVVRAGKARYIGASSMYAWQFSKALHLADRHGWTRFVSMQNHYNLLYREEEREMTPLCRDQGVGVIPWSPLARGCLARERSVGRADVAIQDRSLREVALRRLGRGGRARPRARRRGGQGARRAERADRARLAAPAERGDGADRRSDEDGAPGRRSRRALRQALRRGGEVARGAVRAACRRGFRLSARAARSERAPEARRQNSTTVRIDLPACMRSNASLIRSSGSLCVISGSMSIFLSMYQSTIFGTSVRPRAPPKAVPFQTRPVTSWKGRVAISWPAPGDADDDAHAPAAVAALERLAHQLSRCRRTRSCSRRRRR